jgi:hypothetical protein
MHVFWLFYQKSDDHSLANLFIGLLFHWFPCLFLCQYHVVFDTMTLFYNLECGVVVPPALLFLFRIAFMVYFSAYINFRIDFSISLKTNFGNLMEIALNLRITFSSRVICMILILPIHEHVRFVYLLVSSSILFFRF